MIKLKVTNMRCLSCVHNMRDEIAQLDPGVRITPDVRKGSIQVDSNLEEAVLIKLIKNAGYEATAVTEEA